MPSTGCRPVVTGYPCRAAKSRASFDNKAAFTARSSVCFQVSYIVLSLTSLLVLLTSCACSLAMPIFAIDLFFQLLACQPILFFDSIHSQSVFTMFSPQIARMILSVPWLQPCVTRRLGQKCMLLLFLSPWTFHNGPLLHPFGSPMVSLRLPSTEICDLGGALALVRMVLTSLKTPMKYRCSSSILRLSSFIDFRHTMSE